MGKKENIKADKFESKKTIFDAGASVVFDVGAKLHHASNVCHVNAHAFEGKAKRKKRKAVRSKKIGYYD